MKTRISAPAHPYATRIGSVSGLVMTGNTLRPRLSIQSLSVLLQDYTVKPRFSGFQGIICYYIKNGLLLLPTKEIKEIDLRCNYEFAFVIGGIPLEMGTLQRG